jgi:hypothetical protein
VLFTEEEIKEWGSLLPPFLLDFLLMKFSTFLKKWNSPQYSKYIREKETAKQNYQPNFPD